MTETEAFRLERRCIRKWSETLCNVSQGQRTSTEALWYACLHDLQNNFISYGTAITSTTGNTHNFVTGKSEPDTMRLRVSNLAWLKGRMRRVMRALEQQDPGLVS